MMMRTAKVRGRATSTAACSTSRTTRWPRGLTLREMADDVLGHDDRAVHDDAEVDGSEGEQVGRNTPQVHEDEREEQGEGNGDGHDEGGADVVEKGGEEHDDEGRPFDQVAHDRGYGGTHEPVPAVVVAELHPGGERLLDLGDLVGHPLDHHVGVLALAHEDDALHEVVLVIPPEDAQANGRAHHHRSDVAHADGRALLRAHHDVLDVTNGLDEAEAAHGHPVFAL